MLKPTQDKYRNPLEVGSDRIANAIAAMNLFPNKTLSWLILAQLQLCVISKAKEYLGGIHSSGIKISMEALESRTAQLPIVEIKEVSEVIGRSTVESIQSGLYHGQIGMARELKQRLSMKLQDEDPIVIGTEDFHVSSKLRNSLMLSAPHLSWKVCITLI